MAKVISNLYGEALFDIALERGMVSEMEEQVTVLSQAFAENPELFKLFNHPKITKEEKISVIENAFKGRFLDDIVGFLVLIVEKGRYNEIEAVFDYFHAKVREYNKVGVAKVTSATELSEEQKKQVEQKLLCQTSYESFQMHYETDKSLLGGMVIRIGDRVVDSSIRTKLANMAKDLKKISLANVTN